MSVAVCDIIKTCVVFVDVCDVTKRSCEKKKKNRYCKGKLVIILMSYLVMATLLFEIIILDSLKARRLIVQKRATENILIGPN